MKTKVSVLIAAFGLLLAAATGAHADATDVQPGTWVGTGALEGSMDSGRGAMRVSGPLTLTLRVDEKLRIVGEGSWRLRRLGTANLGYGPVTPTVKGWAALAFSGSPRSVALSGTQYVIGELTGPQLQMPLRVEKDLVGRLVMTRKDRCTLAGAATLAGSATLRWSATHKSAACTA